MAGVTFTPKAAEKVRDTVETVGRWTQNDRPPAKRRGSSVTAGRWMKIGEGEGGKYSWVAQKMNDEGRFEDDEDWGSGDHTEEGGFAVEAKSRSEYVLEGSIVWGTPAPGRDCYVFEYHPGPHWARPTNGSVNFPKRQGNESPGGYELTFLKVTDNHAGPTDEDDVWGAGQILKVFNGYKTTISLSQNSWAQVNFGESGKWWIQGSDC